MQESQFAIARPGWNPMPITVFPFMAQGNGCWNLVVYSRQSFRASKTEVGCYNDIASVVKSKKEN